MEKSINNLHTHNIIQILYSRIGCNCLFADKILEQINKKNTCYKQIYHEIKYGKTSYGVFKYLST